MTRKVSNYNVKTNFTAKDTNLTKTFNAIQKSANAAHKSISMVKTGMTTVVAGYMTKQLSNMADQLAHTFSNFNKEAFGDKSLMDNMFDRYRKSILDMNMSLDESASLLKQLSLTGLDYESSLNMMKGIDKTLLLTGSENKTEDAKSLYEILSSMLKKDINDQDKVNQLMTTIIAASKSGTFTIKDLAYTVTSSATGAQKLSGMDQTEYLTMIANLSQAGIKGQVAGTLISNIGTSLAKLSQLDGGNMEKFLQSMGFKTQENGQAVSALDFQKQFFEIMSKEGFNNTQRAQLLMKIFGSGGTDTMLDFLDMDPKDFQKMKDSIQAQIDSGEADEQAAHLSGLLSKEIDKLMKTFQVLGTSLLFEGSAFNKVLKRIISSLNNAFGMLLKDESINNLLARIDEDLGKLFDSFGTIDEQTLVKIYDKFVDFLAVLGDVIDNLKTFAGFLADPFGSKARQARKDQVLESNFNSEELSFTQSAQEPLHKMVMRIAKELMNSTSNDNNTIVNPTDVSQVVAEIQQTNQLLSNKPRPLMLNTGNAN